MSFREHLKVGNLIVYNVGLPCRVVKIEGERVTRKSCLGEEVVTPAEAMWNAKRITSPEGRILWQTR